MLRPIQPDPARWELRRIAIVGAGAMGTSLAAILGRVVPIVVVARNPERAAQLVRDGARTTGQIEARAAPIVVRRLDDLVAIGGASAIFVATKTTAIPGVAADLRPLLPRLADQPAGLFVVSYQNGIEPGRQLMDLLGHPGVLRIVLGFGATMHPATGEVRITLNAPPHAIGSVEPSHEPVCRAIAALLSRAGLETTYEPAIERRVWEKAVVNAAMNPVAALVNAGIGPVLDSPASMIVERLLAEGAAVARAEGLPLGEDYLAAARVLLRRASDHTPSMVEDVRLGRESEVGQLNRQIIEHARRVGVPTPTHEIVNALIETFDWKVYHDAAHATPTLPSPP
ncbi:MAG TPA: 2-dehydropantoate 2-reductase [Phycisphaerales bacterium]|nr:2-dehydropantoate 2-reductase [Phycisphaerales bacterium]